MGRLLATLPLFVVAPFLALGACQKTEPLPPPLDNGGTKPSGGGGGGGNEGGVLPDGGPITGTVTTLASGQALPDALVLDASYVYWTNLGGASPDSGIASASGSVIRLPRAGGSTTTLVAMQDMPVWLSYGNASLYWVNAGATDAGGAVLSFGLSNSTLTPLATGQLGAYGIASDAQRVYWTTQNLGGVELDSVPITGGTATQLALVPGGFLPGAVAIDASNAYFLVIDPTGGGTVFKTPLVGGGSPDALWTAGTGTPSDVVVVASTVYWVVDDVQGAVYSMPTTGGTATPIATQQPSPARLAADATSLYWTSDTAPGALMTIPLAGGAPAVLASNLNAPLAVAVDDGEAAVYVSTADSILKVAK